MRGYISIYIPLSSRLVNSVRKSVGHPLQGREGGNQITLLTRLLALADKIRDKNKIKYGYGRVNHVKSVESSVPKVCAALFAIWYHFMSGLSLCPCGRRQPRGLLPARPKAGVWRALPRLCVDRTARRQLSSARGGHGLDYPTETGTLGTTDKRAERDEEPLPPFNEEQQTIDQQILKNE